MSGSQSDDGTFKTAEHVGIESQPDTLIDPHATTPDDGNPDTGGVHESTPVPRAEQFRANKRRRHAALREQNYKGRGFYVHEEIITAMHTLKKTLGVPSLDAVLEALVVERAGVDWDATRSPLLNPKNIQTSTKVLRPDGREATNPSHQSKL